MPKPYVTGISPKEGYPGTKVTIRGEYLGKDESDLIAVKICGVDCTLRAKWERENRITTYTGYCIGKGDIVVITKSGGTGTSSVGFQGLVKKSIGPNEETCIWIEEDVKSLLTGLKRTAVSDLSHDNPLNISLDESSKFGAEFYEREFANSSIDMTKENFNPMRFLLENYQGCKFEDLKSGLEYMKKNIGSKTANSSDNLLKNNISSFMDAIKIMKDIQWLSSIDKKNDFTGNLETRLKGKLNISFKWSFMKRMFLLRLQNKNRHRQSIHNNYLSHSSIKDRIEKFFIYLLILLLIKSKSHFHTLHLTF